MQRSRASILMHQERDCGPGKAVCGGALHEAWRSQFSPSNWQSRRRHQSMQEALLPLHQCADSERPRKRCHCRRSSRLADRPGRAAFPFPIEFD